MADGILLINKPKGFTSFDVIAKLRGMSRQKRIGHAGTLDPMATGVLPCLFGTAARLCDILPVEQKTYLAGVKFGISTDTQDMTGTVLCESEKHISLDEVNAVLPSFTGEIAQTPPMYSAVQVNGQRLYDLARQGREVERPARQITIYKLKLLSFDESAQTAEFEATCSKGSYIRTLFHDIGEALGCGAALTSLCRTASSGFMLKDCITIEEAQQLTDEGILLQRLLPVSAAFTSLPAMQVGEWQAKMLCNGVALSLKKLDFPSDGCYSVWNNDLFLGLGTVSNAEDCMKLKKF